jgi:hypothetical protein
MLKNSPLKMELWAATLLVTAVLDVLNHSFTHSFELFLLLWA